MTAVAMDHTIRELPILVLLPHNRCNCRCVMCDIWKIGQVREITERDLEPHIASLRSLKVRWVVLSGGEPLLHSDLTALCRMLRQENIRLTLLSAGLNLESRATEIVDAVDDVIVSIDGPAAVHDQIRNISGAYGQLARGTAALRQLRPTMPIHGRCTVQKLNCGHLCSVVESARSLGLNSLSFLAADLTSPAFNRLQPWPPVRQASVALCFEDIRVLEDEIETLIRNLGDDIDEGFILEKPEKLRRISLHFRAHLGLADSISPRCNAPWVSAVVEADGTVRPCFFHAPIGNIHDLQLSELVNGAAAVSFRQGLDVSSNPTCRNCVCSLFLQTPEAS